MKKLMLALAMQLLVLAAFSQAQYLISYDKTRNNAKVLTGIINKYLVMNDTTFSWYSANQKGYAVKDSKVLEAMERNKNVVQYLIFGGTWCSDTQNILPKFFKLQEQSGVPDDKVTFIGVDENKKSLGNISAAMGITNVPTIIMLKNGKEVGRIVEYGKTGNWDQEIGEILK